MAARTELTAPQNEVLRLNQGRHVVFAPPGSGKTELLGLRVHDALTQGIAPESMLCITFTNRAARNMNERIGDLGRSAPFIGTLHRFGFRFLLANGLIPALTSFLDEEDAHQFLMDSVAMAEEDLGRPKEPIDMNWAASYVRQASMVTRKLINPTPSVNNKALLDRVFKHYSDLKVASCAIDFDDVLQLTLQALRHSKPQRMSNYDWVQVDEVQDLSDIQWEILSSLIAQKGHVVFFGDYDQAIYSFMGASHEVLVQHTMGATRHVLPDNFRSPPYLIDFFNAYALANMPQRQVVALQSGLGNLHTGGRVRFHHSKGEFKHEAQDIASIIVPQMTKEMESLAILTRTNKDADAVSDNLVEQGIAHKRVSGFDLFRRRTIKDVMAFLRILSNSHDRLAWARLLACYGGIGTLKASREMVNQIFHAGMNPNDWLLGGAHGDVADLFVQTFQRGRIVLFDTETTGLDLSSDDIVQIAAVEAIDGLPTGRQFKVFLHTERDLKDSSDVHHITAAMLDSQGQPAKQGLAGFLDFIGDAPLGGHNLLAFDLPMLEANLTRSGLAWQRPIVCFDTLVLARQLHPELCSHTLADLIESLQLDGANTHDALDDVLATMELARHLSREAASQAPQRQSLRRQYARFIERFIVSLVPLWKGARERLATEINLAELVEEFFRHARGAIQYKIDPDEIVHVQTLIDYLRFHTPSRPLEHHLRYLLRELETYSESDLITDDVRVIVSTVHKAKGLEFDGVVVASCVQDVYPHFYSSTSSAIQEDARLLYVAITRARQDIVLTSHDTVLTSRGRYSRYPSSFLNFLPTVPGVERFSLGID